MQTIPHTWHQLVNAWVYAFTLVSASPMRIGAGGEPINPVEPDNQILKEEGKALIPGSTLKGIFRSTLESIPQFKACEGIQDYAGGTWCLDEGTSTIRSINDFSKRQKAVIERVEEGKLCNGCRLFGNPYIQGRVFFNDAIAHETRTSVRDGVMIRRDTETGADGRKFDFEILAPGSVFPVEIQMLNTTDVDRKWIEKVLEWINLGIVKIGGGKSRGLGSFKVENQTMKEVVLDV